MALTAEASRDARWSTSDLSSDQAVSRWMELLSQTIAAMHIDSLDRKRFSASRQQVGLGPIDLNILEASPQHVQRTRSMIARQKAAAQSGLPLDVLECLTGARGTGKSKAEHQRQQKTPHTCSALASACPGRVWHVLNPGSRRRWPTADHPGVLWPLLHPQCRGLP